MKTKFEPLTVQIRDEKTLKALSEWVANQPIEVSMHKAACFHINKNILRDNKSKG
tara:strand:+ start:748 stop:912 length:165 start_codon:yes stop_codon:yes gene_type:complete